MCGKHTVVQIRAEDVPSHLKKTKVTVFRFTVTENVCFNFLTKRRVHLFSVKNPLTELKGEEVKKSFFLAYPFLPLPTAWLTDWPAVKGAFVSALWRKANQILRLVCLREENGAPGMSSAAEMCRQSDCSGRLGLLWPFENYAGGITCLAHGQRNSFCKGRLFIYLFT